MNNVKITYSPSFAEECLKTYKNIREKLLPSSKLRNINNSGPIFIYMFLKVKGYSITSNKVQEIMKSDTDWFRSALRDLIPYYPAYQHRDKVELIKTRLEHIQHTFSLDPMFLKICELLFKAYYPILQYSKEEFVACVLSVCALVVCGVESISINEVCLKTETPMSSVSNWVRKKMFRREKFRGFGKSRERLCEKLVDRIKTSVPQKEFASLPEIIKQIQSTDIKMRTQIQPREREKNQNFQLKPSNKKPESIRSRKHKKRNPQNQISKKNSEAKKIILNKKNTEHETISEKENPIKSYRKSNTNSSEIATNPATDSKKIPTEKWTTSVVKKLKKLNDTQKRAILKLHIQGLDPDNISQHLQINSELIILTIYQFNKSSGPTISSTSSSQTRSEKTDISNPFPEYGALIKIINTGMECGTCGSSVFKLNYPNTKHVFFCKRCHDNNQ